MRGAVTHVMGIQNIGGGLSPQSQRDLAGNLPGALPRLTPSRYPMQDVASHACRA